MTHLDAIRRALREFGLDGWLLYDFRGNNVLARRVLGLEDKPVGSRRFFYFIPADDAVGPTKLVHPIEPAALDHLEGTKRIYERWSSLETHLKETLAGTSKVAMEYAPGLSNPYVSRVDAGTVEAVRALGVEVVSSGDLIQLFEATWDDDQWAMHRQAEAHTTAAFDLAFGMIAEALKEGRTITEGQVQKLILDHFDACDMTTYSPPIVAVNAHSADPHFENTPATDQPIRPGDFVLIDLWAKLKKPRAVYSDLTRVAFAGSSVPPKIASVFDVVARARDQAVTKVRDTLAEGRPLTGAEVDDAARSIIEQAGYGRFFIHRTGHNIGQETHGNGANIDNLETQDQRRILPRTCFSIEPGIYLPGEFGVRSEINVYIDADGRTVHVTGGPVQTEVLPLIPPV
ncbi:peptidase M24 [Isosphaera pallida ATCC 43644]|uniref:Peptidase M24 n=1 Tax=Isosphaera pallida (strain ATCC 43644 / DSM 9630 / IS1B) TaxID=575540 RepID=E8QX86_ISOPI|nr:M24 family metallopeptidase [Isosphaera pallida]ADV60919.1 peptidase M24 [Isosphaera pallida ATCC 43644]